MNLSNRLILKVFLASLAVIAITVTSGLGADVAVRWDANDPAPDGYRIYARQGSEPYDYSRFIWQDDVTTCTLTGLIEGVTYHFVVRAYVGDLESDDSDEVEYTPPITNVDGDGVPGLSADQFPNDPSEWADSDGDGSGNKGDLDDDNDGMPDAWETEHGLDPTVDDSALDADGDGFSNLEEFTADSDPLQHPENLVPDAPVIEAIDQVERVGLTPLLVTEAFFDPDTDDHVKSKWQISTDRNFVEDIILERTTGKQLTTYHVGDMVLDVDTDYYWRVKHIDSRHGESDWSDTATFTTVAAADSDDEDLNGTPEAQEVGPLVDVDANGVFDVDEDNMLSVNSVEGQAVVGVKFDPTKVELVSLKSLSTDKIADKSVTTAFGLVGFKLYLLQEGVDTASVTIHFSAQVPEDASLYKYTHDTGWYRYENAVFAPDHKSVTLTLVDGGDGDEDGVKNGVIIDPSGIAYAAAEPVEETTPSTDAALSTGTNATAVDGGGSGCFITVGSSHVAGIDWRGSTAAMPALVLLASFLLLAAVAVIKARGRCRLSE